jgi:hypothetical protein
MRSAWSFISLVLTLSACAGTPGGSPSLAPRAAENLDPRLPVEALGPPAPADAALAAQLRALVEEARAGADAFAARIGRAEQLAAQAGPAPGESWIAAQQALSAALAARAPVTRALAEIDALAARTIQARGGIGAADMEAIERAAAEVRRLSEAQLARTEAVQARLAS